MSQATERVVYMTIGAFVMCCLLIVVPVAHITFWLPNIVLPEKILTLANTAFNLLSSICLALVINVVAKQSQVQPPQSK